MKRALAAQQLRLSVAAHNIANSATEGYSRQRVIIRARQGTVLPNSLRWTGGGVEAAEVQRQRDTFMDALVRFELGRTAEWEVLSTGWQRLESIMQEPAGKGISEYLTAFWDTWRQLATLPESSASRTALREQAKSLVAVFQELDGQLVAYREELAGRVDALVTEINSLASRVAVLNRDITRAQAAGRSTADLADRRDLLVDRLSTAVGAQVNVLEDGTLQVMVGRQALVDGTRVHRLESVPQADGGRLVIWEETGDQVSGGGQLAGLLALAETHVAALRTRLSRLAETLYSKVNELHRQGYDLYGNQGGDFFTLKGGSGFTLNALQVNPAFDQEVALMAAALDPGQPGDGRNALAIAALSREPVIDGVTLNEFHRQTLAELGVSTATARQLHENQQLIITDLQRQREAVSGVNLDEEIVTLVEAQHAYAAAARVVEVMDRMLATLIDELGLAGR